MGRPRWPAPIRRLRGTLPAEMRVLRGAFGAAGGGVLLGTVLDVLFRGNLQLGFGDGRILVGLFLVFVPAVIGLVSPIWYWVGRPVWVWLDRPGVHLLAPLATARFLPGIFGSLLGIVVASPVRATSSPVVQTLVPFGLIIAVGTPLWYWILRPASIHHVGRLLPNAVSGTKPRAIATRTLLVLGVLLCVSLVVASVIALPIVDTGEQVTTDGLSVAITDTETVRAIPAIDRTETYARDGSRLLLVRIAVENRGQTPRRLPGTSVGDIAVIAARCDAQTFGEPAQNCDQVWPDGPFTADGTTYENYATLAESSDGTLPAGARIEGWLAYRLESRQESAPEFDSMVIVDDVGRWRLPGTNASADRTSPTPALRTGR